MSHSEVGKKVICVDDKFNLPHDLRPNIKKGDVYELLGIKATPCGCKNIVLNVGIPQLYEMIQCSVCNKVMFADMDCHWLLASRFVPYDDSLSELTVEDILNESKLTEKII